MIDFRNQDCMQGMNFNSHPRAGGDDELPDVIRELLEEQCRTDAEE